MSFDSRFVYPPLYSNDQQNNITNSFGQNIKLSQKQIIKYNMNNRKKLRQYMKSRNKSFNYIIKNGFFDGIIYKSHILTLKRDNIIINEIRRAYNKRLEKLHKMRIEIFKFAVKGIKLSNGNTIYLPSDIIPTICAFAVPGSKQYNYMKN